jgi:Tfp pilus assembly protein PilV
MMLKSFTLIETLIAIAVVTLAIVGPFHIAQSVLQTSYTARDELIASALGQEAMEYVRNVRDSNFVYNVHNGASRAWLYGLDGSTGPDCYTHACVVDPGQQTTIDCGSTSCAARPLYLSSTNLYNQSTSGTQTRFTRTVRLTQISTTETQVTVTVSWLTHGATYTVTLTENLRNWL